MVLDRFRWAFCQLDTLRRCMPSSIRKALNGLPITLDDTYERMLEGIPKEKFEHASRLFQCMVAAIRPLRVEELAELFAIDFGPNNAPNLVTGWRPEHPEEAVLSTCSSFITIIDDRDSKIVQFSHFSVKEFLTSDRLQMSNVGNIRQYYIPLEPAHSILARACVTVLMQVDEDQDEARFRALPLGSYAMEHWARHAQFEGVAPRIQDPLAYLFDPKLPYFQPRILLRCVKDMVNNDYPILFDNKPDKVTPLVLAAFCGFSGLAKHLIITHAPDVNAEYGAGLSPLYAASNSGQVDSARVLLDHGADVNAKVTGYSNFTPFHCAVYKGHLELTQFFLEQGANLNVRSSRQNTPLDSALDRGHLEIARVLLDHGADPNVKGPGDWTPYQVATRRGYHDIVQLLLEHGAEGE